MTINSNIFDKLSKYINIRHGKYYQLLYYILFNIFSSIIHAQTLNEIERLKSEYESALNRQSLQKSSEVTDAEKEQIAPLCLTN